MSAYILRACTHGIHIFSNMYVCFQTAVYYNYKPIFHQGQIYPRYVYHITMKINERKSIVPPCERCDLIIDNVCVYLLMYV